MSSQNAVHITGNLTSDPDLRNTKAGMPVCNVRVALNRKYRKSGETEMTQETTFIDVAIWGPRGEAFARHHRKGDLAQFDGRLKTDEWQDKDTGEKRTALKIVAEEWHFVGGRRSPSEGSSSPFEQPYAADDTPF